MINNGVINNNLTRGNKSEIVGWGMPDYSSGITGSLLGGVYSQTFDFDAFVFIYGQDKYSENYSVRVSKDNGLNWEYVGHRFDDVNGNTQGNSFTFLLPKGWAFYCDAEDVRDYAVYPLKGSINA